MQLFFAFFGFIFGAGFGSFIGMLTYRLPRAENIFTKPSFCENCKHKIAWYDNLPVVSFILLKGKCRYCGTKINPKYFLLEIICGLIVAVVFVSFAPRSDSTLVLSLVHLGFTRV